MLYGITKVAEGTSGMLRSKTKEEEIFMLAGNMKHRMIEVKKMIFTMLIQHSS
jgi:hypothetical protein